MAYFIFGCIVTLCAIGLRGWLIYRWSFPSTLDARRIREANRPDGGAE